MGALFIVDCGISMNVAKKVCSKPTSCYFLKVTVRTWQGSVCIWHNTTRLGLEICTMCNAWDKYKSHVPSAMLGTSIWLIWPSIYTI